jgi:indole-3-glycerol phosphate synthase
MSSNEKDSILVKLGNISRGRMAAARHRIRTDELAEQARALGTDTGFPFEKALAAPGMSFICEVKKASPSKGLIVEDFPYLDIAREYEAAGASCISVLTEPTHFQGRDEYLRQIADAVSIPCLRKDFVVDEYQVYEAKVLGASAVLLIVSLLDADKLKECVELCDELGMTALVEAHTAAEVDKALEAGARVVGVNNRDLKNFSVDLENSISLRDKVPSNVLFVAESGIKTAEDVQRLREHNVDAVLIGETLIKAADKKAKLAELKGDA